MAAITWTYTVTNSLTGAALAGANVWATTDISGQIVVDGPDVSNASGVVTFSIEENSEVYVWVSKSGFQADALPDNETVTSLIPGAGTMTAVVAAVPDALTLQTTALDLISDALAECGVLAQGETATSEDAQDSLKRLNRMLEQWRIQRRLCYIINQGRHTLTANATTHTIGPSGTFVADRPTRIVSANIVVPGTPEVHNPINIVERAEEWAQVTAPLLASNVPSHLYCDYAHPDATLYLWPYPDAAYDLELYTWNQLGRVKTLSDIVSLPEGYYDALMYSLAERLCTRFGTPQPIRAQISLDAAKARSIISVHNVRSPKISTCDTGIPQTESI